MKSWRSNMERDGKRMGIGEIIRQNERIYVYL